MERKLFSVVENKGDNIFLNLNEGFDTFEEAVDFKNSRCLFKDKSKLIIIQRVDEV